jgi:hypothetical protein
MEPRLRPGLLERWLTQAAGPEIAEAAWGDLEEEAAPLRRRYGRIVARGWIAWHCARMILQLTAQRFAPSRGIGEVAMDGWTDRRRRLAAVLGAVAALPGALLVVSGLLYMFSGDPAVGRALDATLFDREGLVYRLLLHPAIVLGGLALAVGLNLLPLLRFQVDRQPGTLAGTLAVRLRSAHLAVAALALGLFAVILAYAFTENFAVIPRPPAESKATAAVAVGAGWTAVRQPGADWVVRQVGAAPADLYLELPQFDSAQPSSCRAWSVSHSGDPAAVVETNSTFTLALDSTWEPISH